MPWAEARKRVEGRTLDILISWRDDVDDDTNVMRDVLREVIIISDNEDEDVDLAKADDTSRGNYQLREKSIEIISLNDNVHTQRLDLAREPSELGNDQRVQYMPSLNPVSSGRPLDRLREERRGAQRHQRWEEAVSRQRKGISFNSYSHAAQPISKPVYRTPAQNDLEHPSRISQQAVAAPLHHEYEHQRTMQYDDARRYLPLQCVEYRPHYAMNRPRDNLSISSVPTRQVSFQRWNQAMKTSGQQVSKCSGKDTNPLQTRYSPDQRPITTTVSTGYYQRPERSTELASGNRYTNLESLQHIRQVPIEYTTEGRRFVEVQPPQEVTEVQYNDIKNQFSTITDERRQRRHQSERILPSVEKDEYDARATARIARESPLFLDSPTHQTSSHGHPQYALNLGHEAQVNDSNFNLKRARNAEEVYVFGEEPRRAFADARDGVVYTSVTGRPSGETLRHRVTEQTSDKAPVFVQYHPRVVQLPPRALEDVSNQGRQVYSVPQHGLDEHKRSLDYGREHERVLSHDVRQASYAHPIQQTVQHPVPNRAIGASSIYPGSFKTPGIVQPSDPRIARVNNVQDSLFVPPAEEPRRKVQFYDERGRLVEDDVMLRRHSTMYMSSG